MTTTGQLTARSRAPNKRPDPRTERTIARIIAALPATKAQVIEATGIDKKTVYGHIKTLREQRVIRVARWKPHPVHGPAVPVLSKGSAPDAVDDVPRLTKKQRADLYLARMRGTERYDIAKAKWRARYWVKKASTTPNTWLSALGVHP